MLCYIRVLTCLGRRRVGTQSLNPTILFESFQKTRELISADFFPILQARLTGLRWYSQRINPPVPNINSSIDKPEGTSDNHVRSSGSADWISWLSNNIDYENGFTKWLENKRKAKLIEMQSFSIERMRLWGPEVAVSHFVVAMNGKVKTFGVEQWLSSQNKDALPKKKIPGFVVEAIDLSDTDLIYEGVENLFQAQSLVHLSLARCKLLDEWSITRLVNLPSLVSIDLSGNEFITERCLIPLHHLPNLRKLDLGGIPYFTNQPLAFIMLEELLPNCVITNVHPPHVEKTA